MAGLAAGRVRAATPGEPRGEVTGGSLWAAPFGTLRGPSTISSGLGGGLFRVLFFRFRECRGTLEGQGAPA